MTPDLSVIPRRPGDAESPVFREAWEAQAFAMAVSLHERGIFTWNEWAEGAYLEPDSKYGHQFLEAVRNAKDAERLVRP